MESCTPYQNHHHYLMVVTGSQWGKICLACRVKLISNIKYHKHRLISAYYLLGAYIVFVYKHLLLSAYGETKYTMDFKAFYNVFINR